jgi:predicted transcriptional regulator
MKIKDDILEKWESGEYTIYDIAEEYGTTPEAVLNLLGLVENPF